MIRAGLPRKSICVAVALVVATTAWPTSARADMALRPPEPVKLNRLGQHDSWMFTVHEENDVLALLDNSDRHYTQGLQFEFARRLPVEWSRALRRRTGNVVQDAEFAVMFGQNIYTPARICVLEGPPPRAPNFCDGEEEGIADLSNPLEWADDRPFAGYVHAGLAMTLALKYGFIGTLDVSIGHTGPLAQGKFAQSEMHVVMRKVLFWDDDPSVVPAGWGLFELKDRTTVEVGLEFASPAWSLVPTANGETGPELRLEVRGTGRGDFGGLFGGAVLGGDIRFGFLERKDASTESWKSTFVLLMPRARYVRWNELITGPLLPNAPISTTAAPASVNLELVAGLGVRFYSAELLFTQVFRLNELENTPKHSKKVHQFGQVVFALHGG